MTKNGEQEPGRNIELATAEGLRASLNTEGAFVESLVSPDGRDLLLPRQDIEGRDRGGVPICAPIFGPGEKVGLAQHGFARNLPWEIDSINGSSAKLTLINSSDQDSSLPESYRGLDFNLAVDISSGENTSILKMLLLVQNNGQAPAIVAPGFHPYFPVNDAMKGQLSVESSTRETRFALGQLDPALSQPADSSEMLEFSNGMDDIVMTTSNLSVPVVWSNRPDKFFCVEPTNDGVVADDMVQMVPGQAMVYGMQIEWTPKS